MNKADIKRATRIITSIIYELIGDKEISPKVAERIIKEIGYANTKWEGK